MSTSLPVRSAASVTTEMTENEWYKLVSLIQGGEVVPVLGPELLMVPENGEPTPLYEIWGRELASPERWEPELATEIKIKQPAGGRGWTIYELANLLSQRVSAGDLAFSIDDVVQKPRGPHWPTPVSLRNLAAILDFSLYITTTVDHLMMQAMTEERPGPTVEQIKFMPKGEKAKVDLPTKFLDARIPGVYYLFGATSKTDGTFAKTEDDLIEWSWSLLDKGSYAPDTLYDHLQTKTILLLGCSMPDWLGRFFIHAINGCRPLETVKMYYVSQNCEPGLVEYLKRRRAKVVTSISPVDFVEQLFRRWQECGDRSASETTAEPVAAAPKFMRGAVFLSYFSEDRDKVLAIRKQLEDNKIDTWMDVQELPEDPGNHYADKIGENIRDASFFVPIISRTWERAGPKRFVRREWRMAEDAAKERRPEDYYLQPLVIDDTPSGAKFVDGVFQPAQWTRLRDGQVPPAFIDTLSRGIRNYRR